MDFPRPQFSASSLIGDLKDRFSGGRNQANYDDYYDDGYYEGYPEADDYDVYTYDEDQERSSSRFGRTTYVRTDGYGSRSPRLVSAEDIRATTSAYGVDPSYTRPAEYRPATTSSSPAAQRIAALGQSARESFANRIPFTRKQEEISYDEMLEEYSDGVDDEFEEMATPATSVEDFVSPFQRNTTAAKPQSQGIFGAQLEPNHKSAGLESLFTPSEEAAPAPVEQRGPLRASDFTNPVRSNGREFFVLRPVDFQEAELVAQHIRNDEIVVLALKSTDAELSKRILDFSFGVVAALDAHIECPAPQVFALSMGAAMTLEEKHRLRRQGVM